MAQTRSKSSLASIHERITAFNNKYRNPEALKQLGWEDVPIVDVQCSSSWIEATNVISSCGYSHYINNDWVNKPIALSNHRLFHFDNNFINTLNDINNETEFIEQIDNYFHVRSSIISNGRESRIYEKLFCPNSDINKFSWCYSMSVNGLVNYSVPNSLEETKIDGIIQYNSWLRDGHIETGGDDSISVTLFGEKLYFICAPGTHSVKFEELIRNVDDFMSFVEAGPENSIVKSNIKFYIPQPDLILCQPSLASHAVLTSTLGVSFVWGWEACNLRDSDRINRTLYHYGPGIKHGGYKSLLSYAGLEGALQISKEMNKARNAGYSGLSEHLYAFKKSGQQYLENNVRKCGRKAGIAGANKRMKRSFRIPNKKRKYLNDSSKREGS